MYKEVDDAEHSAVEGATESPTFSIVIPVFNRAHSIMATLQSVLDQTWSDYECLIVDDGSDDGEALRKLVQGFDTRFKYIRQNNQGGGAARNLGMESALGRYIALLDSDDLFLPDKLATVANLTAEADEKDVFYSLCFVDRGVGKYWIRPSRSIQPGEDVGEYLFVSNQFIPTPTMVLPRELALDVKFDPTLKKGQDLDFCLRLQSKGAMFRMIDKPLVVWVDIEEGNRASRAPGYEGPLAWLEKNDGLLTTKAKQGYQSTVLSYYLAKSRPLLAAKYLAVGFISAGVPVGTTIRQAMRSYLPRSAYRTIVNQFIKQRGDIKSLRIINRASPELGRSDKSEK